MAGSNHDDTLMPDMHSESWRVLILFCLFAAVGRSAEWQDAAEANDVLKLQKLLEADATLLNSQNSEGKTALHLAASKDNLAAAKFLIEHGADVNVKSKYGLTALKLASGFGHAEMAEFLRAHGAVIGSEPSKKAVPTVSNKPLPSISSITNTEKLDGFQKRLVVVMDEMRKAPEHGFGPLQSAASEGRVDVVKGLVEGGANVNTADESGFTALHWAVEGGQKAMVDFLLEHNANINALTKAGDTALTIALVKKQGPIIQTLLDHKPDPNLSAKSCAAPLVYAVMEQMTPVVTELLRAGADVNGTNSFNGWTPLHEAVAHNNKVLVETLLPYKPRLDLADTEGLTPLDLAEKRASVEIIDLLRKGAGRPPLPSLTDSEQKLLAAYQRFESLERKGTLPQIRAAILAQEPTALEIGQMFRANTNAVANAYAGRLAGLKSDWQRRTAYDRPRDETTRVELLAPGPRIAEWQKNGWLNLSMPVYRLRVWRAGYGQDRDTFCLVNERWVKLPEEVLREDPVQPTTTSKRKR